MSMIYVYGDRKFRTKEECFDWLTTSYGVFEEDFQSYVDRSDLWDEFKE